MNPATAPTPGPSAPQRISVTAFQDVPPDENPPRCRVAAVAEFTHADGTAVRARITMFQLDDGRIGVGVYPAADRGTVLRWDQGTHADPAVIYWQAPHCVDDQCGSPCGHPEAAR